MATLAELKRAFLNYRRRCGHKSNQVKYSEVLRAAVREFVEVHPRVSLAEIAESLGITVATVKKWAKPRHGSQFLPLKLVDDLKESRERATQISSGNISIQLRQGTTAEEIERVIKLLIAG